MNHELILILDFGSQYTQLIAQRVREQGVYCEIVPFHHALEEIIQKNPKGVILSGGPNSVYEEDAPRVSADFYDKIECAGSRHLLRDAAFGGRFGRRIEACRAARIRAREVEGFERQNQTFRRRLPFELDVWMSHGDHVVALPEGFHTTATTGDVVTAIENEERRIFAVQFHPEVSHTPLGKEILRNFLFNICGCKGDWTAAQFIKEEIEKIRSIVGETDNVVCGLSGGVDSTVAATLVHEAIGNRQTCVFVNNGLLRADEFEDTLKLYKENLHLNVRGVDASDEFYEF